MTLDAMLPNITDEENLDLVTYLQHAEEARQLSRLRIRNQSTAVTTIIDDATWNTNPETLFGSAHR